MGNLRRTTIGLEEEVFRRAKIVAVKKEETLQGIINKALRKYLGLGAAKGISKVTFKDYRLGQIRSKLTRREIYRGF